MKHEELWSQMQALYPFPMNAPVYQVPKSAQSLPDGPHPIIRALGKNLIESLSCFDGILKGAVRTPELRHQAQEFYAFLEQYARRDVAELVYLHDYMTMMALNTFDPSLKSRLKDTVLPQIHGLVNTQVARLPMLTFGRLFQPLQKLQAQLVAAFEAILLEGGLKLDYLERCSVLMHFHVRLPLKEAKQLYHRLKTHVARHPGRGDAYFLAIARLRLFAHEAPKTMDYQALQRKKAFQHLPLMVPLSQDDLQVHSMVEEAERVNQVLIEEQVKQAFRSEILPLIQQLARNAH